MSRDRNQERRRALAPLDTVNLNNRPTTEFYTKPYNRWEGAGKGLVNFGHPMYLTYQDAKGHYHVVPNQPIPYYTYPEDYLGMSISIVLCDDADGIGGPSSADAWYFFRAYILGAKPKTPAQRYKEKYLLFRYDQERLSKVKENSRPKIVQPAIQESYVGHRMSLPEAYPTSYECKTPEPGPAVGYRHSYRQSNCLMDAEFDNPALDAFDKISGTSMSPAEVEATLEAYANPQPLTPYSTMVNVDDNSETRTPGLSFSKGLPSFESIKSLLALLTPKSIGGMRKNKNKSGVIEMSPMKKYRSGSGSGQ